MNNLDVDNQLDETTKNLILSMEKEIESKDKEIDDFKKELEFLKYQLINKNKKLFGQSSEQVNSDQMTLFNDAEKESDLKQAEPTIEEIVYTRNKPSKNIGKKDNLSNLEIITIEHKLSEE